MVEPNLDQSLKSALDSNLFEIYTPDNIGNELSECNVYIITVGTPLKNSKINLIPITEALNEISKYIKDGDLVIIRSTVSIGTCRDIVKPLLDKTNAEYLLAMCPERTVEGQALAEMRLLPQIIGGMDKKSADVASLFFSRICDETIIVDSLEAAELTKLVNNTYRDLMFAFANEVALISNEFGVNPSQVIAAANHNYARSNIAYPGPSGGPCLEKDPWILAESGDRVGLDLMISKAGRKTNESFIPNFLQNKIEISNDVRKIAILGLAFKGNPPSTDTRGGLVPLITSEIHRLLPNAEIYGFESAGKVGVLDEYLIECDSIDVALKNAQVVIISNNSKSFENIGSRIKEISDSSAVIIDFWGFLQEKSLGDKQTLHSWAGEK
jgi:nucleotide sugar dehydrogenase